MEPLLCSLSECTCFGLYSLLLHYDYTLAGEMVSYAFSITQWTAGKNTF